MVYCAEFAVAVVLKKCSVEVVAVPLSSWLIWQISELHQTMASLESRSVPVLGCSWRADHVRRYLIGAVSVYCYSY